MAAAGGGAESWLLSKGFQTHHYNEGRVRYVALPAVPPTAVAASAYFFSIDTGMTDKTGFSLRAMYKYGHKCGQVSVGQNKTTQHHHHHLSRDFLQSWSTGTFSSTLALSISGSSTAFAKNSMLPSQGKLNAVANCFG
jgi:hypothetical protein